MASSALGTYLQDHFGGAAMGSEMATKLSADYPDVPFLADLARDIDMDKATLEKIMSALDVSQAPLKAAAGWIAEKASRVKLSEAMTGDRNLKQLMEFEVLSLGIEGKLSLWRSLIEVSGDHPGLAEFDLPKLADRAASQRAELESHRLKAAAQALAS